MKNTTRKAALRLVLAALLALLGVSASFAAEPSLMVVPPLEAAGVNATTARIEARDAVVFASFSLPFYGELYLRGLNSDGVEIARSASMKVKKARDAGGNLIFMFDEKANLDEVRSFTLEGRPLPPPPPAKPSIGEQAEEIVDELLE